MFVLFYCLLQSFDKLNCFFDSKTHVFYALTEIFSRISGKKTLFYSKSTFKVKLYLDSIVKSL